MKANKDLRESQILEEKNARLVKFWGVQEFLKLFKILKYVY